jgi:hypothetical protein
MNKKIFLWFCIFLLPNHILQANSPWYNWKIMQSRYHNMIHHLSQEKIFTGNLYKGSWHKFKNDLRQMIYGSIPKDKNFWCKSSIGTMNRDGFNKPQEYEQYYLLHCLSEKNFQTIQSYNDTNFTLMGFTCRTFNCSTNTLGHLYYAAQTLEKEEGTNIQVKTIVEFGGGYGNLARIFKSIKPKSTVVIIDIPEVLAIQYFFLSSTLPNVKINMHATPPKSFEENCIHLVPVEYSERININSDLFISTFGLSEAHRDVQKVMVNKKFYNAKIIYISGQLNTWNGRFENHTLLFNGIRNHFNDVMFNPYHIYTKSPHSYEVIAAKIIQ